MGRGNRAYKSAKRSKELKRLKKQEEKRLKRMQKKAGIVSEEENAPSDTGPGESQDQNPDGTAVT